MPEITGSGRIRYEHQPSSELPTCEYCSEQVRTNAFGEPLTTCWEHAGDQAQDVIEVLRGTR